MERAGTIEQLREALSDHAPDLAAAWLFGSVARGTARTDSDVDVAILRGDDRAASTLADLPLDLADQLSRQLGRAVQVVDVGRAPADLVHRVLRDGVLLVDRDRSRRVRFEVDARNRYFDMVPIWREYRAAGRRS